MSEISTAQYLVLEQQDSNSEHIKCPTCPKTVRHLYTIVEYPNIKATCYYCAMARAKNLMRYGAKA